MSLVIDGWVQGLAHEPGRNANYRAGRALRRAVGKHFTVGRCAGDRSVGLNGYFQFYVPRAPGCGPGATQFAQIDSVCWHMCSPWNGLGWGVEYERLNWPEGLTDYQIDRGGLIVAASIEAGIRDAFYDGPLVDDFSGFINHASARAHGCDQHTDGVTQAEWAAIRVAADKYLSGGGPAPDPTAFLAVLNSEEDNMLNRDVASDGHLYIAMVADTPGQPGGPVYIDEIDPTGKILERKALGGYVTSNPLVTAVGDTVVVHAQAGGYHPFSIVYDVKARKWGEWRDHGGGPVANTIGNTGT